MDATIKVSSIAAPPGKRKFAGAGITVYVLDTDIRTTHKEFEGRAIWEANLINGLSDTVQFGHGTNIACPIPLCTLGGCSPDFDRMAKGYKLIAAVNDAKKRGITKTAGINASLGGPYTDIGNDAVKAASKLGITCVASAGNEGDDAANYSPASAPTATTVGAIDSSAYRTIWSNYRAVVDAFVPGSDIPSAGHRSDTGSLCWSGTSMAAPHVAGLAAYIMAKEGLRGSTAVINRIISATDRGVGLPMGSPDRIAYNDGSK